MLNFAYATLAQGRNQVQMMELDLLLAGPEGVSEEEIARRNADAQRQLAMMAPGAMIAPPPKPRKKRTTDGDA